MSDEFKLNSTLRVRKDVRERVERQTSEFLKSPFFSNDLQCIETDEAEYIKSVK